MSDRKKRKTASDYLRSEDPYLEVPRTTSWRLKTNSYDDSECQKDGECSEETWFESRGLDGSQTEVNENVTVSCYSVVENIPEAWKNQTPEDLILPGDETELELEQDSCDNSLDSAEPCGDDTEWFDCEDDLTDTEVTSENEPLYSGAPVSLAESLFLILTFTMRYQLSGECLQDLLVLISLHCCMPNLCKTSVHLFEKYFSNLKSPIIFHKFCGGCNILLKGDIPSDCEVCGSKLSEFDNGECFIEIPLVDQLINLYERKGFFNDLQHRFNRKKQKKDNIEDIFDGDQYKKHFREGGFLWNRHNLSFFWYTDGIPLFKSSKFSIWPMYLMINELPYEKRILKENMLFAGIWFGNKKPCMGTFLEPFHSALKNIADGIKLKPFGFDNPINVHGILLGGTCDLPAKCIMLNMTQFNGQFGCGRCKQPGKHVPSGRGFTHVYPYDYEHIDGPKRTHEETKEAAISALSQGHSVDGVKGPSWFMFLGCDIIRGTAIDYMHQVLLGIVRKLLNLWFSQSHSREPYSLRAHLTVIDQQLLRIKPPNFITRVPRSIAEHMKYWKASECRSFLFYYSVPLLSTVMDRRYFSHYLLLVQAIFILNSSSICSTDVLQSEQMLRQFVCMFATLYHEKDMSANLHLLLHLADSVRDLGPLWVSSCFHFEGINGELLHFFHGTQRPELQIANSIGAMLKFPSCVSNMSAPVIEFYYRVSNKRISPQKKKLVSPGVYVLGTPTIMSLDRDIIILLKRYCPQLDGNSHLVYKRVMLSKIIYHSRSFKMSKKRSSLTVCYMSGDKQAFGQIQHYILVDSFGKLECFAVVTKMETSIPFSLDYWTADKEIPFSVLLKALLPGDAASLDVIPVASILHLCVLIDTDQSNREVFIAIPPNTLEKD